MRRLFFTLVIGLSLALSGCEKHWSWHQKMTVTVETPDGIKTGSSVLAAEVVLSDGPLVFPAARGMSGEFQGEAMVVEVKPVRYLFALVDSMPWAERVFYPDEAPKEIASQVEREVGRTEPVPPDMYPMMVTFDDINDPRTVREVDPQNLAATFGDGVKLQSMTVGITEEPMTRGRIESILPWLNWSSEKMLALGGGKNPVVFWKNGGGYYLDNPSFRFFR